VDWRSYRVVEDALLVAADPSCTAVATRGPARATHAGGATHATTTRSLDTRAAVVVATAEAIEAEGEVAADQREA
jgi:hypothetical protein